MQFAEWQSAMVQAAYVSPFVGVTPPQVKTFTELCSFYKVPYWRVSQLFCHEHRWYQLTEDRKSCMMPFEDWECTHLNEQMWINLAIHSPLNYNSIYLHTLKSPKKPEYFCSQQSGAVDLTVGYEGWLKSLTAKSRYHVKQGLTFETEVTYPTVRDLNCSDIEHWLEATAATHPSGSMHAMSLILWCLSRDSQLIKLSCDRFNALAGFIPDDDMVVFAFNVRDKPTSNVGQRLISEAVKKYTGQFSTLDTTEKTLFGETESYGVYKSKASNTFLTKRVVGAVSGKTDFLPPYFQKDDKKWVLSTKID